MPVYEVTIKEIEIYTIEVEAESEEDAIDKGWEAIDTEEGKAMHHNDSDGESIAYEVEE